MNKKILIIKPSSLGDVIHAFPFVTALKELYPDSVISWLINAEYKALIEGHSLIDEVIVFDRESWNSKLYRSLQNFWRLVCDLRIKKFDMVFDLQGLFRSGIITFLSGGSEKICFKYTREGSSVFYSRRLGVNEKNVHAVDRMLSILEDLGWQKRNITLKDFWINIPQAAEQRIEDILRKEKKAYDSQKLVVINPFTKWQSKSWDIQKYAALGDALVEKFNVNIVISGSYEDKQQGEIICQMMRQPALNLIGKTEIGELAALLKHSSLLISADSGPVHLANALGIQTITLFGPTSPQRTGAYLSGNAIVCKEKDCAPCFKKKCKTLFCMREIEVEDVIKAVTLEAQL